MRFASPTTNGASPGSRPGFAANDLRFNLSHSHDLAMYAFALARDVGVDIEMIRADAANDRIAENFFSPTEVAMLRALPHERQVEGFFNCWTRKEAYVKARGAGPVDRPQKLRRIARPRTRTQKFFAATIGWMVAGLVQARPRLSSPRWQ